MPEAVQHPGVMVAIYPPKGWVDLLAAHAHPSMRDKLHVTLVYLPDVPDDKHDEVLKAVEVACKGNAPFRVTCNGAGAFDNADAKVRILLPGGVGLNELRADIYRELESRGLHGKQKHGFTPHMTLEYHEDRRLPEHFDRVAELPFGRWTVTNVAVVQGDKILGRVSLDTETKEAAMNNYEIGYRTFMKTAGVEDDTGSGWSPGQVAAGAGALGLGAGAAGLLYAKHREEEKNKAALGAAFGGALGAGLMGGTDAAVGALKGGYRDGAIGAGIGGGVGALGGAFLGGSKFLRGSNSPVGRLGGAAMGALGGAAAGLIGGMPFGAIRGAYESA